VAGTAVGVALDRTRDREAERRLVLRLSAAGAALFAAAYAGSYLPSVYANASFWTTSPSYFFIRIGLMVASIGLAYAWLQRPTAGRWSPMMVFGRHSLFVYFIHVEMVYGIASYPLHKRLPLASAFTAFAVFTLLMLGAALLKGRFDARRRVASPVPA
jgi:surface polysaccharide O-acyltransferase-like enzyme